MKIEASTSTSESESEVGSVVEDGDEDGGDMAGCWERRAALGNYFIKGEYWKFKNEARFGVSVLVGPSEEEKVMRFYASRIA